MAGTVDIDRAVIVFRKIEPNHYRAMYDQAMAFGSFAPCRFIPAEARFRDVGTEDGDAANRRTVIRPHIRIAMHQCGDLVPGGNQSRTKLPTEQAGGPGNQYTRNGERPPNNRRFAS